MPFGGESAEDPDHFVCAVHDDDGKSPMPFGGESAEDAMGAALIAASYAVTNAFRRGVG